MRTKRSFRSYPRSCNQHRQKTGGFGKDVVRKKASAKKTKRSNEVGADYNGGAAYADSIGSVGWGITRTLEDLED